jgi:hypothetical protein
VIFVPSDPAKRGFLSDTIYNGASIRFLGNAEFAGEDSKPGSLGGVQFQLILSVADWPSDETNLISTADIGGFEVSPMASPKMGEHSFVVSHIDSLSVYRQFIENDAVDFSLHFANGETRQFSVRNRLKGRFELWGAMLQACVSENRWHLR